jgi:hypothetical protein
MQQTSWFDRNKVLLFGLLSTILLPLATFLKTGGVPAQVIVMTIAAAVLTFLARNLRGQWVSIMGIIGASLATYAAPTVDWWALILEVLAAVGFVIAPPAKSIGYEKTTIIVQAKTQGEQIQPSSAATTT